MCSKFFVCSCWACAFGSVAVTVKLSNGNRTLTSRRCTIPTAIQMVILLTAGYSCDTSILTSIFENIDLHPGSGPSYPSPTYGVVPHYPAPSPVYPAAYGPPGPLQAPRGDWLWEKFHLKFDLFTLGKILLKLLIFKKIVKFIGVICLLMFLPTLIEKKAPASDNDGYGEEMFRSASSSGKNWENGNIRKSTTSFQF